ncbi:hypothetical protein BROUX41_002983 [Berkeleyomyces rouxiae]
MLPKSPLLARLSRFRLQLSGTRGHAFSTGPRGPPPKPSPSSTCAPPTPPPTTPPAAAAPARWRRIPFIVSMSSQPVTSTVSFLILHELTAVVPLVAITAGLHYADPVPLESVNTYLAGAFTRGMDKFGRYFAKKGWFGFELDAEGKVVGRLAWESGQGDEVDQMSEETRARYKLLSHVALAYALTKALLPIRIYVSALATPWLANVATRVGSMFRTGKKTVPKQ